MGQVTRTNFGIAKTVVIPNADILLMASIPFVLVEAPGVGRAIVPCFGMGTIQINAAADYGNLNAAVETVIEVGGVPPGTSGFSFVYGQGSLTTNLLTPVGSGWVGGKMIWTLTAYDGAANTTQADIAFNPFGGVENCPVYMRFNNKGTGALSGGDVANEMTVTLFYNVVETV